MDENKQNNHHRRSIRLKGYDYSQPGAYFVTIVTQNRAEIFGQVVDGEMKLSALGQIVHDEWMRSIGIRAEIQLYEDEFVIMPNHVHGIVWIVVLVGLDAVRPKTINHDNQGARRAPLRGTEIARQMVTAPSATQPRSHPRLSQRARAHCRNWAEE